MDGQHLESEELDMSPGLWFQTCQPSHNPSDHRTPHTPESQASDVSVLILHIKLLNLRRKNQELLHINKKWAEYHTTLRQNCEHQVTELNRRLEICEHKKEEKKTEDLTKNTTVSAEESKLKFDLQEAEREIERLRMQCEMLTSRGQLREEKITRLKERVHRSLESKQTEENIWWHQAQVYKEDFLKERRDREKLKGKYSELEKRFKKIQAELHVYKAQVRWAPSHPSKGASPNT